jgi:hypothetical protein
MPRSPTPGQFTRPSGPGSQRRLFPGRGPRVRAAAGRPGPGRCGGHRRRAPDPRRRRRVPGGRQAGAHYLLGVKANQPTLLGRCARLAWRRVPVLNRTRDRAHGRVELRNLKAVSVRWFGFPHAAQVVQVTRKIRELGTRRWRVVVVYAVTSLAHAQASPARLADLLRGHWAIENGLHWVGCDLRRGPLAAAQRQRSAGRGLPAQPRHRRPLPHRAGQPGRCPPPARPRPTPPPQDPPDHPRMKRTSGRNAGALKSGRGERSATGGRTLPRRGSGRGRRPAREGIMDTMRTDDDADGREALLGRAGDRGG